jgi:glycine/serine hydroxymethyltransferase
MRPVTGSHSDGNKGDLRFDELLGRVVTRDSTAAERLSLSASGSSCSPLARLPLVTDAYGRLRRNGAAGRPTRGDEELRDVETALRSTLAGRLGAAWVTVRPASGAGATLAVLAAVAGTAGNTVACLSPDAGGSPAVPPLIRRLGLNAVTIESRTGHEFDLERFAETMQAARPSVLYVDDSQRLFPVPLARLVAVTREVAPETHIHVDVSGALTFLLGEIARSPLEVGADSLSTATDRGFPGPRKGFIAVARVDLAPAVERAESDLAGGDDVTDVVTLALALDELEHFGTRHYAANIVHVRDTLATALGAHGFEPERHRGCYSGGQHLWLNTGRAGVDAREYRVRLGELGIDVDTPDGAAGPPERCLRIGVQDLALRFWENAEIEDLVGVMCAALDAEFDVENLGKRTKSLVDRVPYAFRFKQSGVSRR